MNSKRESNFAAVFRNRVLCIAGAVVIIASVEWYWLDDNASSEATTTTALQPRIDAAVVTANERSSGPAELPPDNQPVAVAAGEATITDLVQQSRMHSSLELRLDAITALGNAQDPQAAMALKSLLDDPNVSVREETVEALGALGGPESIAGLDYALLDESVSVRQLAIETLAELGSHDAITTLARMLAEADPKLRALVVEELADVETYTATLMLQSFLADEDRQVSELALEYLSDPARQDVNPNQ